MKDFDNIHERFVNSGMTRGIKLIKNQTDIHTAQATQTSTRSYKEGDKNITETDVIIFGKTLPQNIAPEIDDKIDIDGKEYVIHEVKSTLDISHECKCRAI